MSQSDERKKGQQPRKTRKNGGVGAAAQRSRSSPEAATGPNSSPRARLQSRSVWISLTIVALTLVLAVAWLSLMQPWPDFNRQRHFQATDSERGGSELHGPQALNRVRLLLGQSRYGEAEELAVRIAQELTRQATADASLAWLLAAEAAASANRIDAAVAHCERAATGRGEAAREALRIAGELRYREHRLQAAERFLVRCLEKDPQAVNARRRLTLILGMSGRLWQTIPHLKQLLQQRQLDYETLLFLGDPQRVVDFSQQLESYRQAAPEDPLPLLGLARIQLKNGDPAAAESLLRDALALDESLIEAHVRLGEALWEQGKLGDLLAWRRALPRAVEQHPQLWVIHGLWARDINVSGFATQCFERALELDPNRRVAHYQLGQLYEEGGHPQDAEWLFDRHQRLEELVRGLNQLYGRAPEASRMLEAADLCEALGRNWEAWAWYSLIESLGQQSVGRQAPGSGSADWPQAIAHAAKRRSQLQSGLEENLGELVVASSRPTIALGIDPPSEPDWHQLELAMAELEPDADPSDSTRSQPSSATGVFWEDVAHQRGLEFRYYSSPQPEQEGKRIFEFGGGGVGVLDFDLDGWPDMLFTQGCEWPPAEHRTSEENEVSEDSLAAIPTASRFYNHLFWNRDGQSHEEIALRAGVDDRGFGQGVAVGDFNSDGFPDLYVANIGRNRLYQNNGDGTFTDVTQVMGLDGNQWTTSCVIADLDGDGHPDLYDVNYLQGEDLFERICRWEGDRMRICGPATFEADQDQLWLSTGGYAFDNATKQAGIERPDGKGLGLVVGDLDGSGRPSLFVANDQTPNFLFVPESSVGHEAFRMTELGVVSGVAFDENGAQQGCMGVAAGDANGDGLIDLFVTNYHGESNVLYQQIAPGQFVDATRSSRLKQSSIDWLGFGTQFVDTTLDGQLDLILTNGHLDDFTFMGQPYAMPPQYYHNSSEGVFTEPDREELGDYFRHTYRGRGLARLDWNRDGRQDVAITHLDHDASLLENRSHVVGQAIAIQLRGTQSARDAIGTTVIVRSGKQRWTQQMTAGDGYQASNERKLVFGLDDADAVDQVEVHWPSGSVEMYPQLDAGRCWMLIESLGAFDTEERYRVR